MKKKIKKFENETRTFIDPVKQMKKEEREQIKELGSDVTKSSHGNIYTLTIINIYICVLVLCKDLFCPKL